MARLIIVNREVNISKGMKIDFPFLWYSSTRFTVASTNTGGKVWSYLITKNKRVKITSKWSNCGVTQRKFNFSLFVEQGSDCGKSKKQGKEAWKGVWTLERTRGGERKINPWVLTCPSPTASFLHRSNYFRFHAKSPREFFLKNSTTLLSSIENFTYTYTYI